MSENGLTTRLRHTEEGIFGGCARILTVVSVSTVIIGDNEGTSFYPQCLFSFPRLILMFVLVTKFVRVIYCYLVLVTKFAHLCVLSSARY